MDPERTTTMGDGESATTERPFQSMKAVDRTSAKLSTWAASCRGCMAERPSMAAVLCGGLGGAWEVVVNGGFFAALWVILRELRGLGYDWWYEVLLDRRRISQLVVSWSFRGELDARCPSIRRWCRACGPSLT